MNRQLAVYEMLFSFDLEPDQGPILEELAGLRTEPLALADRLARVVAIGAAALLGLGLIMWLAANWPDLARASKFALLEELVVAGMLFAIFRRSARAPSLLMVFLAQGGLLAFFGQTYQTGADTWQLFALWALLGLPPVLASRSDILWLPWTFVTMTAIGFWTEAHAGYNWFFRDEFSGIYYLAWTLFALVIFVLSPLASVQRITGAGIWSYRASVLLAIGHLCFAALTGLFGSHVPMFYLVGLLLALTLAFIFSHASLYDVFALCVAVLAVDVLLIAGAGRFLFESGGNPVFPLLLLGLFSAGIVSASAGIVKKTVREHDAELDGETA